MARALLPLSVTMNTTDSTRQLTFRLPEPLIDRVEDCVSKLHRTGLDVTRADVVRMLLKHALDVTGCNIKKLLATKPSRDSRDGRSNNNSNNNKRKNHNNRR